MEGIALIGREQGIDPENREIFSISMSVWPMTVAVALVRKKEWKGKSVH